jgi:hypothetical protein
LTRIKFQDETLMPTSIIIVCQESFNSTLTRHLEVALALLEGAREHLVFGRNRTNVWGACRNRDKCDEEDSNVPKSSVHLFYSEVHFAIGLTKSGRTLGTSNLG